MPPPSTISWRRSSSTEPITSRLAPTPRIVGVGGNIGIATLSFRERHPDPQITTFEPDPQIAEILRKNLRSAGDTATTVVEAAARTTDGETGFSQQGDDRNAWDELAFDWKLGVPPCCAPLVETEIRFAHQP